MLKEGLGALRRLVMGVLTHDAEEGTGMAEYETILTNPPTKEDAVHVHDYLRFTRLLTFGAAACLVIGFVVLLIL